MSYEMAISNLFNTKEVVFSNDELLKVIEYALKNDLIEIEFKSANTLMNISENISASTPTKENNTIKIPFFENGVLQAEMLLTPKEETKEARPVVKPLDKEILS